MRYDVIGRGLRALRHRRNRRQTDVAQAAGIARSTVADFEAGRLGSHSLDALVRTVDAVGGTLRIDLWVPGGDIYRLLDADHAALQNEWKAWLEQREWSVEAELTFNHFGERGSIDLFAWHPGTRTLLVIELKTAIVDVQALLAGMDRKLRIGRRIATDRGWDARAAVPMLLLAEGSTARRRIEAHAALFRQLELRGRRAIAWLRGPVIGAGMPTGILCLAKLSHARSDDARRAGRQRIRRAKPRSRS